MECFAGDYKTTVPDCSDKPTLDCSELADGYYPDQYNCRSLQDVSPEFVNDTNPIEDLKVF